MATLRNQTHNLHKKKRKFIFKALSYKIQKKDLLLGSLRDGDGNENATKQWD